MRLFRCAGGVPCPYHLHVNPLYHVCNQNVNLFWENYRISPPYLQFYHKTCTIFVPFFCDICSFCQSPVRKPLCFLEPIPQALFRRAKYKLTFPGEYGKIKENKKRKEALPWNSSERACCG